MQSSTRTRGRRPEPPRQLGPFRRSSLTSAGRQDGSEPAPAEVDGHTATSLRLLAECHHGQALVRLGVVEQTTALVAELAALRAGTLAPDPVPPTEPGDPPVGNDRQAAAAQAATIRRTAAAAAAASARSAARAADDRRLAEIEGLLIAAEQESVRIQALWRTDYERRVAVYARAMHRDAPEGQHVVPPFREWPADELTPAVLGLGARDVRDLHAGLH